MAALLVALGAVLAVLAWLFWPARGPARRAPGPRPGVDADELERAERDVRAAADEDRVRDWGPGASP